MWVQFLQVEADWDPTDIVLALVMIVCEYCFLQVCISAQCDFHISDRNDQSHVQHQHLYFQACLDMLTTDVQMGVELPAVLEYYGMPVNILVLFK